MYNNFVVFLSCKLRVSCLLGLLVISFRSSCRIWKDWVFISIPSIRDVMSLIYEVGGMFSITFVPRTR